jgi:PAS domain S-box-containing protein
MRDGMIVLDSNRRIVDINPAAQTILGLSGEKEPIGKPMAEVLNKWPALIERYRGVSDTEDEITLGEGESRRWYELHLNTLYDENKVTTGQVVTIHDISRRKRAESLAQESEVRFRQIVENASDLIYRFDATGHLTYANPSTLHLLGFEKEEDVLGKYFLDLTLPEYQNKLKRFYFHQFLSKTKNTYHEFPTLTADGRELWFGQNVQLIFAGEEVIGFHASVMNCALRWEAFLGMRNCFVTASLEN